MVTRKTATKRSRKATLDLNIDEKSSKTTNKKLNKAVKKMSPATLGLVLLMLAIGALGGFFGVKLLVKNDCFELIGKDEITLTLGESYTDQGCRVIAFGQDDVDKLKIETNMIQNADGSYTSNEEGTYYISYTVDNFKYGSIFKITKIRLISFVEPTEPDEIDRANG